MYLSGFLCIVAAGLLWGTSGIFVHYLAPYGVTSMQMTFIRGFVAVCIFGIYILFTNRKLFSVKKADIPICISSGIFAMLAAVFYYMSMQRTSVSTSVVLMYMSPAYVMVYACLFLGEKFTLKKIFSVVLVILGCVFVSGAIGGVKYDLLGIIYGILSGIVYGTYNILVKIIAKRKINVVSSTFYIYLVMAISAAFISSPNEVVEIGSQSWVVFLLMLGLGIFTFALPHFLFNVSVKTLPASTASSLAVIEPLAATIYSAILFNEPLGPTNIIGLICIVVSVIMLAQADK